MQSLKEMMKIGTESAVDAGKPLVAAFADATGDNRYLFFQMREKIFLYFTIHYLFSNNFKVQVDRYMRQMS